MTYAENPFALTVTRKLDGQTIFNIDPKNQFWFHDLDINVMLSRAYKASIFGLGERVTDFKIKNGVYTIWAKGVPDPIDYGTGTAA
jgi:hypothetical protein